MTTTMIATMTQLPTSKLEKLVRSPDAELRQLALEILHERTVATLRVVRRALRAGK
jgi:hypothetical protein